MQRSKNQSNEPPTWLIGGGYDKKSTYDEWIEAFDGKVKDPVLMGVTAQKMLIVQNTWI